MVVYGERAVRAVQRSEEHTSELQSRQYLVCRLLLEKKIITPPLLPNCTGRCTEILEVTLAAIVAVRDCLIFDPSASINPASCTGWGEVLSTVTVSGSEEGRIGFYSAPTIRTTRSCSVGRGSGLGSVMAWPLLSSLCQACSCTARNTSFFFFIEGGPKGISPSSHTPPSRA